MNFPKWAPSWFLIFCLLALFVPSVSADSVGNLPLGPSSGGILFSPAGSSNLMMQVGGCLPGATNCTASEIIGMINGEPWQYTLGQASGTGQFNYIGGTSAYWAFPMPTAAAASATSGAVTSTFQLIDTNSSANQVGGTIQWTQAQYEFGVDSLTGTVSYTASGTFAAMFGSSGTASLTIPLDPLTCVQEPGGTSVNPCSLWTIATSDPVDGYSAVGSNQTSSTPEPGSLILLVSGICGLAGMIRRKR